MDCLPVIGGNRDASDKSAPTSTPHATAGAEEDRDRTVVSIGTPLLGDFVASIVQSLLQRRMDPSTIAPKIRAAMTANESSGLDTTTGEDDDTDSKTEVGDSTLDDIAHIDVIKAVTVDEKCGMQKAISGSGSVGESEDDLVDKAVRVERGNLYAFLEEDVLRAIVLPQLRLLLSATPKHPSSYPPLPKASSGSSVTVAAAAASVTARKDNLEALALVLSRIFDPAQPFYYPQEAAPVEDIATEGGSTSSGRGCSLSVRPQGRSRPRATGRQPR